MHNKRHFTRIKFETNARIEFNHAIYKVELLDISLKGALIHSEKPTPMKTGDCCILRIHLPSSSINLVFNALLVHLDQNNLGFKFTGEDSDTMTHLRRLLELNIGDFEKVTHELHFLVKE